MNLSRFYKANQNFTPQAVLDTTEPVVQETVWEAIIKDEDPPIESIADGDSVSILETPPTTEPSDILPENSPPLSSESLDETISDEPIVPLAEKIPVQEPQSEPPVDIETIRENAFTSGIIAGREQAEEDFENMAQTFLRICNELDRLRETILRNSAGEMKELVLAISEKIIRQSVTEQSETIVATIKDAIHLAVKSDEFQIQINPKDLEVVNSRKDEIVNSISGLDNIVLKSDPNIERGGCKLESNCCTVDASMTSQIKVVHDSIMAPDVLPTNNNDLADNTQGK